MYISKEGITDKELIFVSEMILHNNKLKAYKKAYNTNNWYKKVKQMDNREEQKKELARIESNISSDSVKLSKKPRIVEKINEGRAIIVEEAVQHVKKYMKELHHMALDRKDTPPSVRLRAISEITKIAGLQQPIQIQHSANETSNDLEEKAMARFLQLVEERKKEERTVTIIDDETISVEADNNTLSL